MTKEQKKKREANEVALIILIVVLMVLLALYAWKPYENIGEYREAKMFIEECQASCGDLPAYANLTEKPWVCKCLRLWGWKE